MADKDLKEKRVGEIEEDEVTTDIISECHIAIRFDKVAIVSTGNNKVLAFKLPICLIISCATIRCLAQPTVLAAVL